MSRKRFDHINCGVAQTLDQLGDWWTLLIVRDAFLGATRFHHFESNLGIAKNILANRLSRLVENGVFTKERLDEPGQRFEYELTQKGRDLWLVLTAMRLWGDKWVFGEANVPAKFRERGTGREVAGLIAVDAKGVPLDASKLTAVPGPGWPKDVNMGDMPPWTSPPMPPPRRNRKKG
ncbi:MAG: helix-turn-helix transcriptional regulator [bacterium]|nr:helix-turn-helix transcriptional regulator [bacterium]